MFYVAYRPRTLLVMFCVLKFYFVDFNGMFTYSPKWRLKMHMLCKVGKNIIFQNKTLLQRSKFLVRLSGTTKFIAEQVEIEKAVVRQTTLTKR